MPLGANNSPNIILNYMSAEENAALLLNATSAGDAGGRADHFTGSVLGAAWTQEGSGAATSTAVNNSVFAVNAHSSNTTHYTRAYTPSGAFRIEARFVATSNAGGFGIFVRDSGATDANMVGALLQYGSASGFQMYDANSGLTQSGASTTITPYGFYYLRLDRNGSNVFTGYFSLDRAMWLQVGNSVTRTITAAKLGVRYSPGGGFLYAVDFVDVIS